MKRLLALFLVPLLIMTACGKEEVDKSQEATSTKVDAEDTKNQSVNVNKGILNVEITLPALFFEGQDIDQTIAEAKKEGVSEVIANNDGSLTYKMSKSKHKEMIANLETSLVESIEEIKNSEDYSSIKDLTHNKSLTEFTLVVDKKIFENSFDGFATISLGIVGMYYQLFNGADSNEYTVTIFIQDETSNEVFDTIVYPDAFEE